MILLGLNANEVCHAFHTILKKRADGIENMRNRAAPKLNRGHLAAPWYQPVAPTR
jgi:hypothetical protein